MTSKGTGAFGKRQKKTHIRCRRCGQHAYHVRKKVCSKCGYGKSARIRSYGWKTKKADGRRVDVKYSKRRRKVPKRSAPKRRIVKALKKVKPKKA